jgi:Putative restriction endonuclease
LLSKSTARFDQGEKFTDYQSCPTLEEYVLVSQTERSIEVRSLMDGVWQVKVYREDDGLRSIGGDRVTFHSVGWEGDLAMIYAKVILAAI